MCGREKGPSAIIRGEWKWYTLIERWLEHTTTDASDSNQ
jgi:hypothetical protein